MQCRFCAEEIPSLSEPCPFCGEVTELMTQPPHVPEMAASPSVPMSAEGIATPTEGSARHRWRSEELARYAATYLPIAFYVALGLVLVIAPFLPGLSLSISPASPSEPWLRTVSAKYFESVLPVALPLLGTAIVVAGTRWRHTRRAPIRSGIVLVAAGTASALGLWSAISLYRLGQTVTDLFSEVTLSGAVRAEFQVVGPVLPLAVGAAVAVRVAIKTRWRAAAAGTMALALALGAGAGILMEPLQSPGLLLERASSAAKSGLRDAEALALAGPADSDPSCDGVTGENGCYDRAWCEGNWSSALRLAVSDVVNGLNGELAIGLIRLAEEDYSPPVASQIVQATEDVMQATYFDGESAGYSEAQSQAARLCSSATALRETQENQAEFDRETSF